MKRSAVSLFSGAGGLDLGLARAGFEPTLAIDSDPAATSTYALNFPETKVVTADLLTLSPEDVRGLSGLSESEPLDLVVGGPPCTPFSKSALWLPWKRHGLDPKAGMIEVFGQFVIALKPKFFVLENVPLLASPSSPYRSAYQRMVNGLVRAGYTISIGIVNSADVGVAQSRRRLFVVGEAGRTASPATLIVPRPSVKRTCAEAFVGLEDRPEEGEGLTGKWAPSLLPLVPPGDNYLYFTKKRGYPDPQFEWRSRYWSFLLKLNPDGLSPTIQAQPGPSTGPFHWENRRLRIGELKRLFGYPDSFIFEGSRRAILRQIGNSVPPAVGEFVGQALLEERDTLF